MLQTIVNMNTHRIMGTHLESFAVHLEGMLILGLVV